MWHACNLLPQVSPQVRYQHKQRVIPDNLTFFKHAAFQLCVALRQPQSAGWEPALTLQLHSQTLTGKILTGQGP